MGEKRLLGEVKSTGRGFELVEFNDHYGTPCTLQQSSLAVYTQPGTSAVWLGPGTTRMHLDVKQVRALVRHLRAWLKTGSFELPLDIDFSKQEDPKP